MKISQNAECNIYIVQHNTTLLAVIFWKDLRQAGILSQYIDDSNNEILVATSTATGQPAGCNIAITNNVQLNFCGILF